MKTISIKLEEKTVLELEKLAQDVGMSVDELAKRVLIDLSSVAKKDSAVWGEFKAGLKPGKETEIASDKDFEEALKYILTKNKDLYKRLA